MAKKRRPATPEEKRQAMLAIFGATQPVKPEPCPASTISGQPMADRRGPLLHSTEDRVKVAADIDAIRASLVIERDDPSNSVELRDWYGLMAKMLDHTSLILAGNEEAIAFVHECHRLDREQQQQA